LDPFGNPLGPPQLKVEPAALELKVEEGNAVAVDLVVKNRGGLPLLVSAVEPTAGWIALDSAVVPVTLEAAQAWTVRVMVGKGATPGIRSAGIRFETNDEGASDFSLGVALEVVEKPLLFEPTLENIFYEIFNPLCGECHKGALPDGNLKLSRSQSYKELVNVPSIDKPELMLVLPFQPDQSYLIHKLEGEPEIVGDLMPDGDSPLSADQIEVIRRWIANGALDN
jgi:hypothetical protein